MKSLIFCGLIQFSIVLIFIPLFFIDYSKQTIELDRNADNSDYASPTLNQGEFIWNHEQSKSLTRHRRGSGLLEFLNERRKKRNYTSILAINMKNWLNIEISKRDQLEQTLVDKVSNKGKGGKDKQSKDADYTSHGEQPVEYETEETTEENTTDMTTEAGNKTRPIVYNNTEFRELCNDPVFTAVDSSLDGTEVLVFKGDKFYVMENLKYGSGNLVTSGVTSELLPKFDSKGFTSMVTIKEGPMRGYIFAFYDSPERAGWSPVGYTRTKHVNEFKKKSLSTLPKKGFQAVLHNRDILNPLMIGLNGKMVYYYKTDNKTFTKHKEVTHDMSKEKFPPGITAGFSMPNGYIYLFKDKEYCVRELYYEVRKEGVYCDLWLDNKLFLGCYGQYPPPFSMEADIENFSVLSEDQLCDNFKTLSLEQSVDGLSIMAFNRDKYWNVLQFPEKPEIRKPASAARKWKGFGSDPETILIVPEGQHLRGSLFAFKKGKYIQWAPDGKLLEKNKKIEKFNAIIHNSDILNPMAVAFDEKSVYYYSTDSTSLKLNKTVDYSQTDENWPKGITTGLTINTHHIYLFRGDIYCLREWKCTDKKTNCCKKWLSAKELFHC